MDRCAVLVDAGYLLGAAGTMLARDRTRSSLVVDYQALVVGIIAEAEEQTGLPVLRVLWYDGSFDTRPTPEHRTLGVLPDVKVRLGVLVKRGDKIEQKGVDSYLQRDLTALARNHAVADVVLLGGDEDLRRGLDEAQDYGLKVHLWGVEAAAPQYNQSRTLIAEADRRWVLSADWISQYVSVRGEPGGHAPVAAADESRDSDDGNRHPDPAEAEPAGADDGLGGLPEPPVVLASPADLAGLARHFGDHGARLAPYAPTRARDPAVPRLAELSTQRQKWQDNEEDATSELVNPDLIGSRFGRRWAARASSEQLDVLLAYGPQLPRHTDGELLHYANNQGIDTWEDEAAKFAVRAAALKGIDEVYRSRMDEEGPASPV
jgi:uncharacterized LabA/DUF88 family protein